jgi:hypothetical protein
LKHPGLLRSHVRRPFSPKAQPAIWPSTVHIAFWRPQALMRAPPFIPITAPHQAGLSSSPNAPCASLRAPLPWPACQGSHHPDLYKSSAHSTPRPFPNPS